MMVVPAPARLRPLAAGLLPLLLVACAATGPSTSPGGGGYGMPAPAPGTPPAVEGAPGKPPPIQGATPLATEQRFLQEWFRGTPVVIATQAPSLLQVTVPLAHSFDAGKADVKPALNAVLERVAESMRRHPGARITVQAPTDAAGAPALAQARAQRVRDSLGTKGVAGTRVALLDGTAGAPLLLSLAMPAVSSQPIARRNEPAKPAGAGVQTISTGKPVPMWTEKKQP